jgi:hypothetical protein
VLERVLACGGGEGGFRKFQNRTITIAKMSRRVALRHSNIFSSARNPFTAV